MAGYQYIFRLARFCRTETGCLEEEFWAPETGQKVNMNSYFWAFINCSAYAISYQTGLSVQLTVYIPY